ncbi:MAG: hypothetical protein CFH41_00071 [Alphaproteobacteria bacterium MarineAlpha11_Bin1]|nr:MAG: hypothetical protein CFH41_00071 [Alphaproteobacteria bacterium MarineAlpha11_Bin1]|tara:strand:+ start:661 stop:1161 length:501 start_codon:yes stop_codon:yes gene_type:complete
MSESLIFALVIALTVYMFMRRLRMMKKQKRIRAEEGTGSKRPLDDPGSMPRLGSPGTITREQIKQLKNNDFTPERQWSKEEAQLILDTVTYLRAVIYEATGEATAPIDVQNQILKFILTDNCLREYVYEWGLNQTRDDKAAPQPTLDHDEFYQQVEAEVLERWESS